uniref:Uncharacterized protein n=1 Tax=Globisporangium ultimum (strain ATCC 200006 / CBS 805.95 / DAOM BR144) TaxID=431595 RepID=K3WIK0_GLOUD
MFPAQGANGTGDAKKFDPYANQWMREAMESRQLIDELKAHNDKLQRDVYALNSKVSLIYECCADLGVTDRVGDLMQKKLHNFQVAQVARQMQTHNIEIPSPKTPKKHVLEPRSDDEKGFICGSAAFHELAAFSSSYEGQITRENFHRKNMFDAEETKFRDQLDIFGNPKLPSPKGSGSGPSSIR